MRLLKHSATAEKGLSLPPGLLPKILLASFNCRLDHSGQLLIGLVLVPRRSRKLENRRLGPYATVFFTAKKILGPSYNTRFCRPGRAHAWPVFAVRHQSSLNRVGHAIRNLGDHIAGLCAYDMADLLGRPQILKVAVSCINRSSNKRMTIPRKLANTPFGIRYTKMPMVRHRRQTNQLDPNTLSNHRNHVPNDRIGLLTGAQPKFPPMGAPGDHQVHRLVHGPGMRHLICKQQIKGQPQLPEIGSLSPANRANQKPCRTVARGIGQPRHGSKPGSQQQSLSSCSGEKELLVRLRARMPMANIQWHWWRREHGSAA